MQLLLVGRCSSEAASSLAVRNTRTWKMVTVETVARTQVMTMP